MESKSYGRDAVISTTQLVQYEDDDENEDKLDSSRSDHRAPSRETLMDLGGAGGLDPHLHGQLHIAPPGGMHLSQEELVKNDGDTQVEIDVPKGVDGNEHENQETSEGDIAPNEGEVGPGSDMASEAMRVFCAYGTTDVGHGDLTTSSTQEAVDGVNEYSQEEELQDRVMEGVLDEAPGDQSGGYIADEVGGVEGTSSFSEMQQTQLRAQILIYGDLIKGVLPEHTLMLTAFSEDPEGFSPESDGNNLVEWEPLWRVAALKQQSELERQAEEELAKGKGDIIMTEGEQVENALPENLEPGTPSTAPSRVAEESLKEDVYPAVMPGTADLSVTPLDTPSIDVNEDLTVNLDVVVDNIVATTVNSIDNAPLQHGANRVAGLGVDIDTSGTGPQVVPVEGLLANEAGHNQVTRSPSLDPWLKVPNAAQRPPLSASALFVNPSSPSGAWPTATWPSPAINFAHSSQEPTMSMPVTNVIPHANLLPYSTLPSHPVNGGATGVTPMIGNADNLEEDEPGSRKRKKGAGKTRERKASTSTPRSTPRPRGRGRKGSAAQVASPPTTIDPNFPVPSRLIYESSAAVGVGNAASPTSPLAPSMAERRENQAKLTLHADTATWVEQARVSFEEAMSAANSAHEEAQFVKKQAPESRFFGNEAKYASAADAVKVAASVAKAAADAAKVAYEAALQARIYVTEGLETGSGRISAASNRADKDGGAGGRRSAIAAAKEEARKRASGIPSANKANPQGTDAVLRAAKLMTEAAAEAGAVLAKGNATPSTPFGTPLALSFASPAEEGKKSKSSERRGRPRKEAANAKGVDQIVSADNNSAKTPKDAKHSWKKGARRKGKDALDNIASATKTPLKKADEALAKQSPEKSIRRQLEQSMASASNAPDALQAFAEGSLVEVMNDEEGLRGGWFSAQVLELRPGQAYVQYDEILTDDGKTKLKEWFPLEGKLDAPEPGRPRIRLISADNMALEEGRQDKQRKRRRTASGNRIWTVGDRADAFVQDGWWEGVVKQVDEDDENKITMYFPGEGDTQTVKAWNLRPSLVWKDGKWEQWSGYGKPHPEKKDEEQSAKRLKAGASPKGQARKTKRKASSEVKSPEEGKDSSRPSRRGKLVDPQGDTQPSPAVVTTRSSPRQKLPPKRKDGASKLASPESEVSTPNQVSSPVNTRARSLPQDAVISDKEPSKGRTPATGSGSQKKSPVSQKVGKKNQPKENVETPSNMRNLRNNREKTPNPVIGTPSTRQKAKAGASTQNLRSARV